MVPTFILAALPIFVALGLIRKYREYSWGTFKSKVSLDGKVFVITGCNSGIGKETARELAKRNACVVMACRDLSNVNKAISDLRKTTSSGVLVPMHLDLESFQSIKQFSENILEKFPKIHVLINNAGVYFPLTETQKTKHGFEMNFGVNHLGHFLLTKLLLDRIKESAPSRIIIVSSKLHEKGYLDIDDLNMEKRRDLFKNKKMNPAYCASKLANMYHCRELASRLKGSGVDVYAVCPGFTYTGIFRHTNPKWWQYLIFAPIAFFYLRTARQGAQTVLHCACSDSIKNGSGKFFRDCKVYDSQIKFDQNVQTKLWEKSETFINQVNAS